MKKFLKKTFIYGGVFVLFVLIYSCVCDLVFKNDHYLNNSKRYWQLSIKKQKFDYVLIGSSRALRAVNVRKLDSLTKQKGINFGLDGSGYKENYISLKLFLINNNKAKRILLQIDPYSFMSGNFFSNAFHAYSYLPFWNYDIEIQNVLHEEVPINKDLPIYIPYLSYLVYNNYYSPIYLFKSLTGRPNWCDNPQFNCSSGDVSEGVSKHLAKLEYHHLNFSSNEEDEKYYKKILELARDNEIEIIGFTSPSLQEFDSNYEKLIKEIGPSKFYKQKSYWLNKQSYFADMRHLNLEGRNFYTKELSVYLKNLNK